jgi:hypothetical protein
MKAVFYILAHKDNTPNYIVNDLSNFHHFASVLDLKEELEVPVGNYWKICKVSVEVEEVEE